MIATHYVVCMRTDGVNHFLLWQDGDSEPDRYATDAQSNLIAAASVQALKAKAKELNIEVSDQDPQFIDIDEAQRVVRDMRPNESLPENHAQLLLEAWNALEDLSNTLHLQSPLSFSSGDAVYEKLFCGNNLPSVAKGSKSQITLSKEDVASLSDVLGAAIKQLEGKIKLS